MILLLLVFFHFIIYWALILSSPPCTKRSLWPVKHQRQVWPVCHNKSEAKSTGRVRKHLKSPLSYTCGIWSTQKIFDLITQAFVFKACNNGNNKRGAEGERIWAIVGPISQKHADYPDFHREDQWICFGFFSMSKHSYKSDSYFLYIFPVTLWKNAARTKFNLLLQILLELYQKL